MSENSDQPLSRYLNHLPAIFREAPDEGLPDFLGRFLLAFEHVLTGRREVDEPGLEEILDGIIDPQDGTNVLLAGSHRYFEPGPDSPDTQRAPSEFLDWLGGWVAFSMYAELDDESKRVLISRIVAQYQERGTKAGLTDVLSTWTGLDVDIQEETGIQVGETATVGVDTVIEGWPHHFTVRLTVDEVNIPAFPQQRELIRFVIDQEKPAHTYYDLRFDFPSIQVGVPSRSTVGVNTVLGTLRNHQDTEPRDNKE